VAFRLRLHSGFGRGRFTAALVAVALIPVAADLDALGALAIAAAICAGLIAYEALRFAAPRAAVRGRTE
jgi:hypothetical protein